MKDLNIVCPHGNDCKYVNISKTYFECPRFIDLKNIRKCDDESKENLINGLKNNIK